MVPKVRFKGFTDEWEQRKLSDLFIKGGSGGTPKSTNKAFYDGDIPFLGISDITKSNGFINNTEKHISSDGLNSSAAWIVSKGAISLAMYASVGKLAILNIDAATSQAFYNMIFDDYDLRDFVYQRLNKANELLEWNKLISTGTQSNLNADKVKNFQMYLPKNHDEIKLISTFFKQIDNTIVLHEEKQRQLEQLKKALLQKMFADKKHPKPELRFKGFSGDWEQRKLGEVFNQTLEYINPNEANLELWSVTVERGLTPKTARYNREALVKKNDKFKVVHDGDIVYNPMNLTIGAVGFNKSEKSVAVSGYYVTMNMNSGFNNSYFQTWLKSENAIKQYKLYATGSLIEKQRVQFPTLSLIKSYIPTFEEQQKIGSFFQQLDNTIALQQKQIDKLNSLKKSLLQNMFI